MVVTNELLCVGTLEGSFEAVNRVYSENGIAPTVNTMQGGGREPKILVKDTPQKRFFRQAVETLESNDCKEGDMINAFNKTVDRSGVCPTLTTRPEGFKTAVLPVVENKPECVSRCRIRKLTPKECFRLMGVSDDDADKMMGVNSNSQCYKQAGNSIVVPVLEALFRNMNIGGG